MKNNNNRKVHTASSSFAQSEGATSALMFALMLLPIVCVVGFALDYRQASNYRSDLQYILDGAVLAAAVQSGDEQSKKAAALKNYNQNKIVNCRRLPDITFEDDIIHGKLDCDVPTNLLMVIGVDSVRVDVTSSARLSQTASYCLHALNNIKSNALIYNNKRGPLMFVGSSIIAPECSVMVNSSSSSALFIKEDEGYTFSEHCIVGGVSGDVTQIHPQPNPACTTPTPDPLASRVFPSAGSCGTGKVEAAGGTTRLQPGTFCGGIDVSGTNVVLEAGTYHVTGGDFKVQADASIKGEGITIIMHPGSGVIEFETEGVMELKAEDSTGKSGFLIVDKNNHVGEHLLKTSKNDISSMTLDGVIYTPQDHFELFWKRAGVGANEKPLYFTNFGMIADTIDLHGYNQLYISVPDDPDSFPELASRSANGPRLIK